MEWRIEVYKNRITLYPTSRSFLIFAQAITDGLSGCMREKFVGSVNEAKLHNKDSNNLY